MKYKYTRKQLSQAYGGYDHDEDFIDDLLAQKEDRKESLDEMEGRIVKIIKNWLKEDRKEKVELFNVTGVPFNTPIMFKRKNGRIGYGKVKPTTSPLEIEEIEKMSNYADTCEYIRTINSLISNQKKLSQYIKENL